MKRVILLLLNMASGWLAGRAVMMEKHFQVKGECSLRQDRTGQGSVFIGEGLGAVLGKLIGPRETNEDSILYVLVS